MMATAVTKHGVELLKAVYLCFYFFKCESHFRCKLFLSRCLVGYKFVQRGIEKTYGDSIAVHSLEDALEVAALHRKELGKSLAAAFYVA